MSSYDDIEAEIDYHVDQYTLATMQADEEDDDEQIAILKRLAAHHEQQAKYLIEQAANEIDPPEDESDTAAVDWEAMLGTLAEQLKEHAPEVETHGIQGAMMDNLGDAPEAVLRSMPFMCGLLAGMGAGVLAISDRDYMVSATCDDESCPDEFHLWGSVEAATQVLILNMVAAFELHDTLKGIDGLAQ